MYYFFRTKKLLSSLLLFQNHYDAMILLNHDNITNACTYIKSDKNNRYVGTKLIINKLFAFEMGLLLAELHYIWVTLLTVLVFNLHKYYLSICQKQDFETN